MAGDLHCHTTLSDGSLGIEEVIAQAKRVGLEYLAITDYDTLSSANRSKILAERYGISVIPAAELSAWDKKRNKNVHILCYAPQKPDRLEGLCLKSCQIRKESVKEMLAKVMEIYPITEDMVYKYAKSSKSLYKSHIMRALINYGYATEFYGSVNDSLFKHPDGKCLVTREYPDVNFVIDLIHSSKGVAVLAHPYLFDNIELMHELIDAGKLDGIEVNHYSANDEQRAFLTKVCKENDLIMTGGSDFHGLYNDTVSYIGSNTCDDENIEKLKKLIHINSQKANKNVPKSDQ